MVASLGVVGHPVAPEIEAVDGQAERTACARDRNGLTVPDAGHLVAGYPAMIGTGGDVAPHPGSGAAAHLHLLAGRQAGHPGIAGAWAGAKGGRHRERRGHHPVRHGGKAERRRLCASIAQADGERRQQHKAGIAPTPAAAQHMAVGSRHGGSNRASRPREQQPACNSGFHSAIVGASCDRMPLHEAGSIDAGSGKDEAVDAGWLAVMLLLPVAILGGVVMLLLLVADRDMEDAVSLRT
jgi:hypothetical protein